MKKRINHNGFTMLEVVAVLVIMGMIAVVAVSRMTSNDDKLIATADMLTSQLRLVQARAMNMSTGRNQNDQSVWGVRFISSTRYHMFYCEKASECDAGAAAKMFPNADGMVMDITGSKVEVTNGAGIIAFNRFGTPYTDQNLTNELKNQLTLILQVSNGGARSINITPQTGMITI